MGNTDRHYQTVIVGLGKTGYSCVRYLTHRNVDIAVTDTRPSPPMLDTLRENFPDVPLFLGGVDQDLLTSAENVILSPGITRNLPSVQAALSAGVNVIGDIELFCRQVTNPVIAITGSNGKSTVTTLFAEIAKASGLNIGLGGNIGIPALDLLFEENIDAYILELSSFQLETVSSLNAHAAVVLNVTADHMDRYNDINEYANSKARIYMGNGAMVINLDDPLVVKMKIPGRRIIGFTLNEPGIEQYGIKSVTGVRWIMYGSKKIIPVDQIKLAGDHNVANVLAALALGETLNIPNECMVKVLQTFSGLPHRSQWIANINGVDWINDSKGTNCGATCAAIKGLSKGKKIILIAGGESKNADFSELKAVAEKHVRETILIGRDAPKIKLMLQNVIKVHDAANMEEAVKIASDIAVSGDVVLLSPACASFDMFNDYQHRGDTYTKAVLSIRNS